MELNMSAKEVVSMIKQLHENGETLSKKKVKKTHPELMRCALHYYPNWDYAMEQSGIS